MKVKFSTRFIVAVLVIFTILSFIPNEAFAATQYKDIEVNKSYTAELTKENKQYYFSFRAPADGYFTVNVAKKDVSTSAKYKLAIKNADGSVTYQSLNGASVTSTSYGTKSGVKYYLAVSNDNSAALKTQFTIKVNFKNSDKWDNEPNNNQATAKVIAPSTNYYGIISDNDDGDFFAVTAPSAGYFNFSLKHNDVSTSGRFNMSVLDVNGNVIYQGSGKKISTIKYGVKPNTKLYIKIKNYDGGKFKVYKLNALFTADNYYEQESNATAAAATKIDFDKEYKGVIGNWASDDADFYKFSTPRLSKVTLTFGPADVSKVGKWNVYLVSQKGKQVKLVDFKESTQTVTFNVGKGNFYLKVTNGTSAKNKEYKLKLTRRDITMKSKKPTIISSSVTGYKKNSTSRYFKGLSLQSRVPGAEAYQVKVSTKASMKNPILTIKLKGNKKLLTKTPMSSSSKVFYVQCRPYVTDAFGTVIYGKMSNVKKVVAKK